jgi:hypothetical protein
LDIDGQRDAGCWAPLDEEASPKLSAPSPAQKNTAVGFEATQQFDINACSQREEVSGVRTKRITLGRLANSALPRDRK